MKVGLLYSSPFAENGGAYTFQQDLFRCFLEIASEANHEFHVICEPGMAREFEQRATRAANVYISPMSPSPVPRRVRAAINVAARALRYHGEWRSRESLVVSQRGIEFLFSFGHYAHEAFDTPYMTTVLDLQHWLQPWFPEVSRGTQWQSREHYFSRYLSRATYVITGTKEGQSEIERFFRVPESRIRILPLPTPRYAIEAPQQNVAPLLEKLGVPGRYLFYPAQFWPHKNHVNLFHALRLLTDRGEDMHLVLAGSDHGNASHVRQVARDLGLQDRVRFLGFVAQDDLIALYQGAFALTFPTYFGPDNLPPLEAFALGCPVIASDVPGAREQLGDAAMLVAPSDPVQIATAIKRLADAPAERLAMINRGRAHAVRWTSSEYLKGVFALLDEFARVRRCWSSK